ncbi:hypothetical protein J6590_007179 [Homalodisca vitripennis]|nr:hypothetical protein J6590_007179 [Homalodisca vitripennis]
MPEVRWRRRSSEHDDQEMQLYNIRQQVVVKTRRTSLTKEVSSREKRNPLLERVKNTKLSCFRSAVAVGPGDMNVTANNTPNDDCQRLIERPLTGPLARRMAASIDDLIDDDVFLKAEPPQRGSSSCSVIDRLVPPTATAATVPAMSGSSSCLSAKLRAMSEKYLKCSTNRFLAKLYRTKPDSEVPRASPSSRKAKLRPLGRTLPDQPFMAQTSQCRHKPPQNCASAQRYCTLACKAACNSILAQETSHEIKNFFIYRCKVKTKKSHLPLNL